jgi:hypothetical protein
VARLLATVVVLLLCGIPRAMEGARRTLMPHRGDLPSACACVRVRSVAPSAAVRAGRSSGCAQA